MAEDRAYAAREVHRKVYRDLYEKCTDAELRLKKEIAYQKTLSIKDPRDGQLFLAEMEVCNEILNARQEIRDLIQRKSDEWKNGLQAKKGSAALNLKAAATPNGQLILSILEDMDGLVEHELHNWCDEIAELPDEDFAQLLTNLIEDGVIEKGEKDGKYHLITPCTVDMRFDPEYAKVYWNRSNIEDDLSAEKAAAMKSVGNVILQIIADEERPMSGFECRKYAEEQGYKEASHNFLDSIRFMTSTQKELFWMHTIRRLVDKGILTPVFYGKDLYGRGFFPDFRLHYIDPFCDFAIIGYQEPKDATKNKEAGDEE